MAVTDLEIALAGNLWKLTASLLLLWWFERIVAGEAGGYSIVGCWSCD